LKKKLFKKNRFFVRDPDLFSKIQSGIINLGFGIFENKSGSRTKNRFFFKQIFFQKKQTKADSKRIYIKGYYILSLYPKVAKGYFLSLFGEGYFGDVISLFFGFQSLYPISFYDGFLMFKVNISTLQPSHLRNCH
jgi:hypothetical protein